MAAVETILRDKLSRKPALHLLDASSTIRERLREDTAGTICAIQFRQGVLRLKWLHPGRFIYFIIVGLTWSGFLGRTKSVTYVTTLDVSVLHISTWRVRKPIIAESPAISRDSARAHVYQSASSLSLSNHVQDLAITLNQKTLTNMFPCFCNLNGSFQSHHKRFFSGPPKRQKVLSKCKRVDFHSL